MLVPVTSEKVTLLDSRFELGTYSRGREQGLKGLVCKQCFDVSQWRVDYFLTIAHNLT